MAAMLDSKYWGSRGQAFLQGLQFFADSGFCAILSETFTHSWWWRDHGEQQSEGSTTESPRRGCSRGKGLRQCFCRTWVSRLAFGDNLKVIIHIVSLLFPWNCWPLPYVLHYDWVLFHRSNFTWCWLFKKHLKHLRHTVVLFGKNEIE